MRGILFTPICVYPYRNNDKNKADFPNGKGVASLYGDLGGFDMLYYRRNTIAADPNDLWPTDTICDALGCEGALHLHLSGGKSPMRYLVDSASLVLGGESSL